MSDVKLDFFRTSDTIYALEPNKVFNAEVSVDFEKCANVIKEPYQRYKIVHELFKQMDEEAKERVRSDVLPVYFRVGERKFILHPKSNLILRIIAYFLRFFKIIKNETKIEYSITESILPWFFYKPKIAMAWPEKNLPIEAYNSEEYKSEDLYSDPFTRIAKKLFQKFEHIHSWRDVEYDKLGGAKFQIIVENDHLVVRDDSSVTDFQKQNAIIEYRKFVEKQFGKKIIDRIQVQYGFSFDRMIEQNQPLTAEVIYRINVGTSHVEVRDIKKLAKHLQSNRKVFPVRETLGIAKLTKNLELSGEQFSDWVNGLDINKEKDFARLMSIYELTDAEKEKIFTGRTIRGKISGWYTLGDGTKFKPWLDQQEFSQVCYKIRQRTWDDKRNWHCFIEDLAFVLCKKHLYQKQEGGKSFRVGAIIPAPNGYYKVTSWINNTRGIFSYTLEPTCKDSNLPAIKLYRSTSSSRYSLDGTASYKNDFSPINSPGYEGSHHLFNKKVETDFFNSRTIPVWVAYHSQPGYDNLKRASQELIKEIEAKCEKPTLKQFIRTHDSDFLELIHKCRKNKLITRFEQWKLLDNSLRYAVRYGFDSKTNEIKKLEAFLREVPQKLKAQIEAIRDPELKAKARAEAEILIKKAADLLEWWDGPAKNKTPEERELIVKLNEFIANSQDGGVLKEWSDFLALKAKERKEDIASKTHQDLALVGHSLGGACAQRFMVYYSASTRRVPLPGHTLSAHIFDDPAINEEDNEAFIAFGNEHRKLLEKIKAKFIIVRRQEAGDFVPQSGEVHLGAVKNENEQKMEWLDYDAVLQAVTSKAKSPDSRDYVTPHARKFGDEDEHGVVFTRYDSHTQYQFDKPQDAQTWHKISELWELPSRIQSDTTERVRTYFSAMHRSGILKINSLSEDNPEDDELHGNHAGNLDENGVLAVTL